MVCRFFVLVYMVHLGKTGKEHKQMKRKETFLYHSLEAKFNPSSMDLQLLPLVTSVLESRFLERERERALSKHLIDMEAHKSRTLFFKLHKNQPSLESIMINNFPLRHWGKHFCLAEASPRSEGFSYNEEQTYAKEYSQPFGSFLPLFKAHICLVGH